MAAGKTTQARLGAYLCFEDESGQGLRPPKARSWAPAGQQPVIHVRGGHTGRVNIAGVVCFPPTPQGRPHFFYDLLVCHGRTNEATSFTWSDYRNLIIATHQRLGSPLVWLWDNLNIHLAPQLKKFAAQHADWLRIYQLPTYAPELNPAEGLWSLLKRSIANFIVPDVAVLTRIVKRQLKKIQYRPHLITGCLRQTGLILYPP